MIHLPILRAGAPYYSLERQTLRDVRTGAPVAEMSLAIPGVIARDFARAAEHKRALERVPVAELLAVCRRAAHHFAHSELPLGDTTQTSDDYLHQLAATTGMPVAMGRANMGKIVHVLEEMEQVLGGLTRGLDLSLLDTGWGEHEGRKLSYLCLTDNLGAVLPNNSPGVHTLWLPAIPLKVPLVLKPGSAEPWTPWRIAQAFYAAGCPQGAISFYPTDYAGATEVLLHTGRSLFFGDTSTVEAWRGTPKVQVHGPGWSKVILGPDAAPRWQDHLEMIAGSITKNGGRSCINASSVWTPEHGRELAEALARRLAAVEARSLDDPAAELAAFPDPSVARAISQTIDEQLESGGAEDLTARFRSGGRVAEVGGCTFLLPTVIWCEHPGHPLAQSEYVFPFAAVVETPAERMLEEVGPTLVGTVVSEDPDFLSRALACRSIDRLNLGAIATYQLAWDQPHEGNLFDHLYQQRAFQTTRTLAA